MKKIMILFLFPFLIGCASAYKPLRPDSDYYQLTRDYDGLQLSYKMGVLRERYNKKYAKREDLKGIRVVAVKLQNNTVRELVVGKDFHFYTGDSQIPLLEPTIVQKELKQGVPIYLLYLLLTPMQLYSSDGTGDVSTTPIGLIIGPGIALGNMIGAGAANENFLRDLEKYNMIGKMIPPGQTVSGLIGIRDNNYNPIEIRFVPLN